MESTMADQKKYLRTLLGECRAALTPEFARVCSTAIQSRLLATDCYRASSAIALYSPIKNEVATATVAADAISSGKEIFFPRLGRERAAMAMVRVRDLSELVAGAHGVPEPPADGEIVAPSDLAGALIVVPGVAFGPQGQRLGRGGGHYDRFIAALPDEAITVGLAYSFQLLDGVPQESHDRRLHYIITESALIRAFEPQVRMRAEEAGRGGIPG
jgi:5-formyltetrahydrofolate cyclo-ligase